MFWRRCAIVLVSASTLIAVSACGRGPSATPQESGHAALRFTNAVAATVTAGSESAIRIAVTDAKATISESGKMPAGMSFVVGKSGTATLIGNLPANTGGKYTVLLTASDSGRSVSQAFVLTVDQQPAFTPGDPHAIAAQTSSHNEFPILTTGYPAATVTSTGQLPSGISFQALHGGGALISGSPGFFESPCSSNITLRASNSTGTAVMHMTVDLKNLRCSLSLSTILSMVKGTLRVGPYIFKYGKVAGQWIVQNGQKVGKLIFRNGKVVAADAEVAAEEDPEA